MSKPEIIAIAALGKRTKNICHEGDLLWHISDDLKHVKRETLGYPIIMGRKTYESIGKPLPDRTNIILTHNTSYDPGDNKECQIVHSLDEALKTAKNSEGGNEKIFIFGGAEIYSLALPKTDRLMLTLVDSDKEGTAQFPDYPEFVEDKKHGEGIHIENGEEISYEWIDYVRAQ